MYFRKNFNGTYFIYFWLSRDRAINNDKQNRLFEKPFFVSLENQKDWRITSRPDMIAPELLTYWGLKSEM